MTKRYVHLYLPLRHAQDKRRRSSADAGPQETLRKLIEEHRWVSEKVDQIVREGGRMGLNDPLVIQEVRLRKQIQTLKRQMGRDAPYGSKLRTMSSTQLIALWKDPGGDEGKGGEAINELVRRGMDPKTGRIVGVEKAKELAAAIGEYAGS